MLIEIEFEGFEEVPQGDSDFDALIEVLTFHNYPRYLSKKCMMSNLYYWRGVHDDEEDTDCSIILTNGKYYVDKHAWNHPTIKEAMKIDDTYPRINDEIHSYKEWRSFLDQYDKWRIKQEEYFKKVKAYKDQLANEIGLYV